MIKVGDFVRVINCEVGIGLPLGSIAKVLALRDGYYQLGDTNYALPNEVELVTFNPKDNLFNYCP